MKQESPSPNGITVVQATLADRDLLIDTLTRAYADDPVCRWLAPRDAYYGARFRRIFELYWDELAFPFEQIWTTCDRLAASLWLPPTCWRLGRGEELALLPDLLAITGLRHGWSRWRAIEKIHAQHPVRPHWYLLAQGVAPEARGQGRCAALLRPVLDICDRTDMPAYLETSHPDHIDLYRRYGFEVNGTVHINHGPDVWLLWREPQTARLRPPLPFSASAGPTHHAA